MRSQPQVSLTALIQAEELQTRLQREKEDDERANTKKTESSDDVRANPLKKIFFLVTHYARIQDLLDYLEEIHVESYHGDAPIIIDKEQDELLSKFKRLQPAQNTRNNSAEKSAPSSGLSSLINSNNTNANNELDVDALASATWSTSSLMEGIIYDAKNNHKKSGPENLSLEDFTNSILFRPPEPESLIFEEMKIPASNTVHEPNGDVNRHDAKNSDGNVQLLNEELMVQQLAMFDKKMNEAIYSGNIVPMTKTEQPIEFLPQSFERNNVVDVFAHVNNDSERRENSPPKTIAQINGDSMVAVRPKKEIIKENTQEKLGPPPSYDSLVKIVEEKKQEQKAAAKTPAPAPVKNVTPVTANHSSITLVKPVQQQTSTFKQQHATQQHAPVVKDNKEQLLAAAKAKADSQQLEMMLSAQPSAPPMEGTSKGTEVFSELKNFIEESKSVPTSIPSALTEVTNIIPRNSKNSRQHLLFSPAF